MKEEPFLKIPIRTSAMRYAYLQSPCSNSANSFICCDIFVLMFPESRSFVDYNLEIFDKLTPECVRISVFRDDINDFVIKVGNELIVDMYPHLMWFLRNYVKWNKNGVKRDVVDFWIKLTESPKKDKEKE